MRKALLIIALLAPGCDSDFTLSDERSAELTDVYVTDTSVVASDGHVLDQVSTTFVAHTDGSVVGVDVRGRLYEPDANGVILITDAPEGDVCFPTAPSAGPPAPGTSGTCCWPVWTPIGWTQVCGPCKRKVRVKIDPVGPGPT